MRWKCFLDNTKNELHEFLSNIFPKLNLLCWENFIWVQFIIFLIPYRKISKNKHAPKRNNFNNWVDQICTINLLIFFSQNAPIVKNINEFEESILLFQLKSIIAESALFFNFWQHNTSFTFHRQIRNLNFKKNWKLSNSIIQHGPVNFETLEIVIRNFYKLIIIRNIFDKEL